MNLELLDAAFDDDRSDIDRENRAVSDMFRAVLEADGPLPLDLLRGAQAAMAASMTRPDAVELDIATPGGPLTLRKLAAPATPRGVFLHIHGGGFMLGSAAQGDLLNGMLRDQLGVTTISVNYRLAPEHPHPAAIEDCVAAASWVIDHLDDLGTDRLLIGGESAGAYFAAMTLIRLRDQGRTAFAAASLVSGAYDLSGTPSQTGIGAGPDGLTPQFMDMSRDALTPGMTIEQRRSPEVSPLYADLATLCPALFTVGRADHLLDDNVFMATRWRLAGNPAELIVIPDAGHMAAGLPSVQRSWVPRMVSFLSDALDDPSPTASLG
jgi:acetyl esterase